MSEELSKKERIEQMKQKIQTLEWDLKMNQLNESKKSYLIQLKEELGKIEKELDTLPAKPQEEPKKVAVEEPKEFKSIQEDVEPVIEQKAFVMPSGHEKPQERNFEAKTTIPKKEEKLTEATAADLVPESEAEVEKEIIADETAEAKEEIKEAEETESQGQKVAEAEKVEEEKQE